MHYSSTTVFKENREKHEIEKARVEVGEECWPEAREAGFSEQTGPWGRD